MAKAKKKDSCARNKMHKVMSEFKHGTLRSGKAKAPLSGGFRQAVAIGLSSTRKACGSGSVKRAPRRGGGGKKRK